MLQWIAYASTSLCTCVSIKFLEAELLVKRCMHSHLVILQNWPPKSLYHLTHPFPHILANSLLSNHRCFKGRNNAWRLFQTLYGAERDTEAWGRGGSARSPLWAVAQFNSHLGPLCPLIGNWACPGWNVWAPWIGAMRWERARRWGKGEVGAPRSASTPLHLPWGMHHFYFMKKLVTLLRYFSPPLPPPTSSPLETASEILRGAFLTSEPACVGGSRGREGTDWESRLRPRSCCAKRMVNYIRRESGRVWGGGSHSSVLFNPFLLQEQAARDWRWELAAARDIFINGLCWRLWREDSIAPSSPFADRLCTLGKTVGKGGTAPNLGDDSCGKSGCFSSVIWKAAAFKTSVVAGGCGGGWGCREKNAIYKAINASTESAITQNYFLKFGLYSILWRKGSMGTLLPIKPDTEAGVSHTKGDVHHSWSCGKSFLGLLNSPARAGGSLIRGSIHLTSYF